MTPHIFLFIFIDDNLSEISGRLTLYDTYAYKIVVQILYIKVVVLVNLPDSHMTLECILSVINPFPFYFIQIIGVCLTVRYRNQKDPRANPSAFL